MKPPRIVCCYRIAASVLAAALLLPGALLAQDSSHGDIEGTVLDQSSGKYLEGAEITVSATGQRATSGNEGRFEVRNVPAGPQELAVQYPGLDPQSLSVQVVGGQTARAAVKLGNEVVRLETFTVVEAKQGMSAAIAVQKMAPQTKFVAAADQFGDIPEGNAAEYLKFLPGVGVDFNANDARAVGLQGLQTGFTTVVINGNPLASGTSGNLNRRFEFEQAPINNIARVEVYKTITPDLPAQSTGGQINFVPRSGFDLDENLFTYRVYANGPGQDFTLRDTPGFGNRVSEKIYPGIDTDYSFRINDRFAADISYKNSSLYNDYPKSIYTWDYNPKDGADPLSPAISNWALINEQKITRRQAFAGQLDWHPTPHTQIGFTGQWAWYDLIFTDRTFQLAPGTVGAALGPGQPTVYAGTDAVPGGVGKGTVTDDSQNRAKYGTTYFFGADLKQDIGNGSHLELRPYWTQANSNYRDVTHGYLAEVQTTQKATISFKNVGALVPAYTVTDPTTGTTPINVSDITTGYSGLATMRSRPQSGWDTRDGGAADYKLDLDTAVPLSLKVGYREDDVVRHVHQWPLKAATATLPATGAQLAALADPVFTAARGLGYGVPGITWLSPYAVYSQYGLSNLTNDTQVNSLFDESTKAGYAAFDTTLWPHLEIYAGARFEDFDSNDSDFVSGGRGDFHKNGWYPSGVVKYSFNQNLILRGSVSRTIGLPDYSDLNPSALTVTDPNVSTSTRGSIAIYNPHLTSYKVTNFDAAIEYYFQPSGILTAEVYRKQYQNYIITATQALDPNLASALGINYNGFAYPGSNYDVAYKFNVPESGYYNGIELAYSQSLSFLPKPFNGLGIQANATLTSVEDIHTREVLSSTDANLNRTLQEQVKYAMDTNAETRAANLVLNYSIGSFGFLVRENYVGKELKAVSQKTLNYTTGPQDYYNELQFAAPRALTDVRVEYKISPHFRPYVEVDNIFNRPIIYLTNNNRPYYHSEFGDPAIEFGVRGTF